MQSSRQHIHQLNNGLTLVAESMPWLQSASFSLSVPAGCSLDPADRLGLANFACEMVQRGCGDYDSRQFIEELEGLGADYSSTAAIYQTHFGAAVPAANLLPALRIYRDVVRNPRLPADQLEDGRNVCYQEIRSLEDDLSQKVLWELRLRQYGNPLGRSCLGTEQSVAGISLPDIADFHRRHYQPDGAILSVAGQINWGQLRAEVEKLFGDWQPQPAEPSPSTPGTAGQIHLPHDSQQTHIGLAYPAVPYNHPDYFQVRGAVGVLSDGMSSRLFNEIREKRGLCYTVYASLHTLKDRGSVVCYVGTSAERAQLSLDVLMEELSRLRLGIEAGELDRLKVQIRSSLVMQQESSRSRAAAISGDWFHLGRIRSVDEINQRIDELSVAGINEYLHDHPAADFNLVTLGPAPLELEHGISTRNAG